MNNDHRIFITRTPRLGLSLRLAASLRLGGALGVVSVAPLVLGPTTEARAQDTLPPRITFATPADPAPRDFSYAKSLPTLTGTVVDEGARPVGVRDVRVTFLSLPLNRWWNGTAFASTGAVRLNATISGSNWSYSAAPTGLTLPDGLYIIQAYATDTLGNAGGGNNAGFAERRVYIDNTAPSNITFEQPEPGMVVTNLGSINGRAFDASSNNITGSGTTTSIPGSGVDRVQVSIKAPNGLFWNGTEYQATEARLPTDLAGSFWSLSSGPRTPDTLPDGDYVLTAYARDALGNESSQSQTTRVQQPPPPIPPDVSAPVVSLDAPADNTFAKGLAIPSGTVSDTGSAGLQRVVVDFFSDSAQKWWDGTSFSANAPVGLPTTISNGNSAGGSWSYTGAVPSGANLPDGVYVVIAFGDDKVGNRGRDQSVVIIDNAPPTSLSFEQPAPSATTTSLVDINGRAADNPGGSGVARVDVTIQRPGDLQYWNGASYQAAPVRLETSLGGGFWSLKTALAPGANLPPGDYVLTAYAQDKLGNEASRAQTATVTRTVTPPAPDTITPSITLLTPSNESQARALEAPSGTASDTGGSGLQRVRVAFFQAASQKWWNGSAFASDSIVELDAALNSAASTWRYPNPPAGDALTDGLYVVLAFADDGAGNRSRAQSVVSIDNTRPVRLTFEQPTLGAQVTDLSDINGFVADNVGGVGIAGVQVVIRNSAGQYFNGTDFVDALTRLNATVGGGFWSLQTGLRAGSNLPAGSYSLGAFAQDKLGNETSTSIAVQVKEPPVVSVNPSDITAPRITLAAPVSNSFSKVFPAPRGTVSEEAGGSGLRGVRVAFFRDTGSGGLWWNGRAFASATIVELEATVRGNGWVYNGALPGGAQLPDGLYVVLAFADDKNGNRNRAQAVLNIDNTAPVRLNIESPRLGALAPDLANIFGRVEDNAGGSNIAAVQVAIRNPSGQFWNGSTYQAAPIRLQAQVDGTFWSLRTRLRAGAALPAGVYSITAYAQDRAGNEKITAQSTRVVPDLVPPVVRWTTPTAGAALFRFPTLSGTVSDTGLAGVDRVEVELIRIRRTPTERDAWWNGRIYQAAPFRLKTQIVNGRWTVTDRLPNVPYLFSTQYTAVAFGIDRVGNTSSRDVSFFIDRFAPAPPLFGLPRPNATVSSLGPIVITVRDSPNPGQAGSGVARADFLIRRDRDVKYWNGSTFVSQPVYLPGYQVLPTQFRRDGVPSGGNLLPGFYTIQARIADRAGNLSISTNRVRVRDAAAPTVSIFTPASGVLRADFGVIAGSVSDSGGSGLASVRVGIRRLSDNAYWNGTAFTSTVASLDAVVTGANWSLRNVPTGSQIVAGDYEIIAVASDREGNSSRARVVVPLVADRVPATITVSDPRPNTFFRRLERVSGTAVDNAGGVGVDRVVVGILRNSDGLWWNGRAFTDAFFGFRATLSGNSWTLSGNLLPAGTTGQFTVVAQAFDKLNNAPQNNKTWEKAVTFNLDPASPAQGDAPTAPDTTPAAITVSDPRPNATFRRIERITGTAVDNAGGVGLDRVAIVILRNSDGLFWNGSAFAVGPTELRATLSGSTWSLSTNLPPASALARGQHTILAQAFDKAQNFSQRDVPITLDPEAPAQGSVPSTPGT